MAAQGFQVVEAGATLGVFGSHDFSDGDAAAGPCDAREFSERLERVGEIGEGIRAGNQVEASARERQESDIPGSEEGAMAG